ncbi:surface protease GP63, partial [Trypanosoma cruzi]
CLVMQVRLGVVEKGGVRWVPCTDGATIAWATRPYGGGSVICRGHAQVCTISAAAGRLLPVVSWDGEERVWSRTVSPTSTEQGLPRGIRPCCREHWDRSRHPTEGCRLSCSSEASVARGEVYPAMMPRKTARSYSWRQGPK